MKSLNVLVLLTFTVLGTSSLAAPASKGRLQTKKTTQTVKKVESLYPKFDGDVGASTGTNNGWNYFEVNVGLNYHFNEVLTWRNAPFFRIQTSSYNLIGIDTSLRANYTMPVSPEFQPRLFAGMGMRIANHSNSAPFMEAGLNVSVGRMNIGAGIKYILHDIMDSRYDNDLLYSANVSGGVSF